MPGNDLENGVYGRVVTLSKTFTPGGQLLDNSQPGFPVYHRKIGNPEPLGLSAFALTTFFLSMVNINARGVDIPNLVVCVGLGYGGLVQLCAGMWALAVGNTFVATAFSSYGGFWISFALIFWPNSGILTAYSASPDQFNSALGFYLAGWFIFTFILLISCLRSSIGLIAMFGMLDLTFLLLMAHAFNGHESVVKAAGWCGLITAFISWYLALAGLLDGGTSVFRIPVGELKKQ